MKRALTKNWGLKLLAFVFSVLLWIIVMNIEDPVDERTFSGIQVTVTHPEIVTNPGNTYQILDDSRTISVTVKAKRSILNKIKTDDIRATADMKNLDVRTRSLIPIDISIPSYAGRFEATANPINLRVSIELGKSETFPIAATSSGTPRDGYQVGELKAEFFPQDGFVFDQGDQRLGHAGQGGEIRRRVMIADLQKGRRPRVTP